MSYRCFVTLLCIIVSIFLLKIFVSRISSRFVSDRKEGDDAVDVVPMEIVSEGISEILPPLIPMPPPAPGAALRNLVVDSGAGRSMTPPLTGTFHRNLADAIVQVRGGKKQMKAVQDREAFIALLCKLFHLVTQMALVPTGAASSLNSLAMILMVKLPMITLVNWLLYLKMGRQLQL